MTDQELIRALASYGLSNGTTLGRHIGLMDVAAGRLTAALEDLERATKEGRVRQPKGEDQHEV